MKTYLINLDRSPDRLSVMTDRLKAIDVTFERVSAIDGINLETKEFVVDVPNALYPYTLTAGEIGCYLSHRKCWQKIVDSGEDWGLVLEDDCIFQPCASQYLTNTNWIPKECKLIHFYYTTQRAAYTDKTIKLPNGNVLFRVRVSLPVGAYAYLMSREAALTALKLSKTILEPVDNYLFGVFSPYPNQINSWRLQGCILKPCLDVNTTITGRKKKAQSLYCLHPGRLMKKALIKYTQIKMAKIMQYLY